MKTFDSGWLKTVVWFCVITALAFAMVHVLPERANAQNLKVQIQQVTTGPSPVPTSTPEPVATGQPVAYWVMVQNVGSVSQNNVQVRVRFPGSWSVPKSGLGSTICTFAGGGGATSALVTCNVAGQLAAGGDSRVFGFQIVAPTEVSSRFFQPITKSVSQAFAITAEALSAGKVDGTFTMVTQVERKLVILEVRLSKGVAVAGSVDSDIIGTVFLNFPVSSRVTVQLSISPEARALAIPEPNEVTVVEGSSQASFRIKTTLNPSYQPRTSCKLTATLGQSAVTASFDVEQMRIASLVVQPSSTGPNVTTGTGTLTMTAVPLPGTTVTLRSSQPAIATFGSLGSGFGSNLILPTGNTSSARTFPVVLVSPGPTGPGIFSGTITATFNRQEVSTQFTFGALPSPPPADVSISGATHIIANQYPGFRNDGQFTGYGYTLQLSFRGSTARNVTLTVDFAETPLDHSWVAPIDMPYYSFTDSAGEIIDMTCSTGVTILPPKLLTCHIPTLRSGASFRGRINGETHIIPFSGSGRVRAQVRDSNGENLGSASFQVSW